MITIEQLKHTIIEQQRVIRELREKLEDLRLAVGWMLYIDTPENFEGRSHIEARAKVEKLLTKEDK